MTQYETLGVGYAERRRPEPRIAERILAALGDASSVVNVGAGAGSYEPVDRRVLAVEPSARMLRQRRPGSTPAVQARAEELPFADRSFASALAVLTLHHWSDWRLGVAELRRVAARAVVLTWDPAHPGFWLVQQYFPDLLQHDRAIFPPLAELAEALGGAHVEAVPIPADCRDGFLGAYWRRPECYLLDDVRQSISTFARLRDVEPRLQGLRAELADGTWRRRNGHLLALGELDLGYRLVRSEHATPTAP
jgi:SAM-dependent methyltransferase